MYCSGWARRGPSGIIGTNITDARSVVAAIVEDVRSETRAISGFSLSTVSLKNSDVELGILHSSRSALL